MFTLGGGGRGAPGVTGIVGFIPYPLATEDTKNEGGTYKVFWLCKIKKICGLLLNICGNWAIRRNMSRYRQTEGQKDRQKYRQKEIQT